MKEKVYYILSLVILFFTLLFISCSTDDKSIHEIIELELPLGLHNAVLQIPKDNPLTKAKINLGRKLYFDERLSIDGTVSCSFCHNPVTGFSDGRYTAMGILGKRGIRNSGTLFNRVFSRAQFWDGRVKSIEGAVIDHIQNPDEMNNTTENVVNRLKEDKKFRQEFKRVFKSKINIDDIAKAIACYVRTMVTGNSRYDKFMAGDKYAMSPAAQRGLKLFTSERLNCTSCHSAPNLTDEKYHNNGSYLTKNNPDMGRYNYTKNDSDKYKFKTPTLRDIARTSPYMHDGSLKSLGLVVDFYSKGGAPNDDTSIEIKPLNLSYKEKSDLIEFLRSLSGTNIIFIGNQF